MTESLLLTKRKKKGFTLIELIVVIAIIAIIALIAIPKVMGYQNDAKKQADISNAKTISNMVAAEITKGNITYPSSGLTSRVIVDTTTSSAAPTMPASPAEADYESVAKYWIATSLQTIPKMQYLDNNKNNFYVGIDGSGTVIIWDASSSGNQIYPKPDTVGSDIYYK